VNNTDSEHYKQLVKKYSKRSNSIAIWQMTTTLLPFIALWASISYGYPISGWLCLLPIIGISLLFVRFFVLMHECGHGSLFRSRKANKWCGFALGVICAMPQHVWSKHHAYHHATNGDWSKYRGPIDTMSTDEYAAMTIKQQRFYRYSRHVVFAPLAGLFYLLINPRYTWVVGSLQYLFYAACGKRYSPRYWKTKKEYWHMCANNIVLITVWIIMCWTMGAALFFGVYLISMAIAGSTGLILFTVQHNYEGAYATSSKTWDYHKGAIEGTSYLLLPGVLNWFTANIGYHHIHHLSATIPNYRLAQCHNDNKALFNEVKRIPLTQVLHSLKYILWDTKTERIISIREFEHSHNLLFMKHNR